MLFPLHLQILVILRKGWAAFFIVATPFYDPAVMFGMLLVVLQIGAALTHYFHPYAQTRDNRLEMAVSYALMFTCIAGLVTSSGKVGGVARRNQVQHELNTSPPPPPLAHTSGTRERPYRQGCHLALHRHQPVHDCCHPPRLCCPSHQDPVRFLLTVRLPCHATYSVSLP